MTEKATFGEKSDLNWRREENHFTHPLCARPPSAQVWFMATAVVVSQAKPLGSRGTEVVDAWEVVHPPTQAWL